MDTPREHWTPAERERFDALYDLSERILKVHDSFEGQEGATPTEQVLVGTLTEAVEAISAERQRLLDVARERARKGVG